MTKDGKGFFERGGFKFILAVLCVAVSFIVTVGGGLLVAFTAEKSSIADALKDIIGNFAIVLSVSIGAFTGTNSLVSAMALKHGSRSASSHVTREETVTVQATESKPAPSP